MWYKPVSSDKQFDRDYWGDPGVSMYPTIEALEPQPKRGEDRHEIV